MSSNGTSSSSGSGSGNGSGASGSSGNGSGSSGSSSKGVLSLHYSHGLLYSLIVRQLYDDGFIDLAKVVANSTNTMIDREFPPKQLAALMQQALGEGKGTSDGSKLVGLTKEEDDLLNESSSGGAGADADAKDTKLGASSLSVCVTASNSLYGSNVRDSKTSTAAAASSASASASSSSSAAAGGAGATAGSTARKSKAFPAYVSKYTAQHKNAVTCARFSGDGSFAATGSADCTIRILEVSKMHYNAQASKTESADDAANRPIYRAYFDHSDVINDCDFHPIEPFLASASKDCTIKLFDHSKVNSKRAAKQITESHAVRSIAFHPSGDFLLAATEHQIIRLYDVSTFQAFVSPDTTAHHFGAINHVRWSGAGNVYASCAKDGHVKVWDTVSNRCVVTVRNAHGGSEVASVSFSSSGKYLLTSGKDSVVRLWDVGSGKQVTYYTGAHQQKYRMHCAFDYTQDFVMSPDESTGNIVVWDTRTGEQLKKVAAHSKPIRCLVASPTEPSFMSCGEDQRAKFWSAID